ncbi:hypothetical protein AVEN_250143-1 [Araneus ventricosus]|uniref:Nucleic-acid-binding protein from transposon X-element n=1 Tax=Araneus ventricosus TaxID=182803 RepID=A0A4Y2K8E6_ARAVE|nr:hypothetical protein AVEN_250143-1 [Araneus ventricosus]
MLRVSNDYNLHLQAVNSAFPNTTSTLAHGYIKIFPEDDKSHKGIIDLLRERNADFYVILPSNERPVKIVIKGVPPHTPITLIKTALENKNFNPHKIVNLTQQRSKKPLPMFLVEVDKSQAEQLFQIRSLLNLKVTIENFKKRPGFTQCWKCNYFHHSSNNCESKARCLKCGKNHRTAECEIKDKIPNPKCINCGKEGHVASWRGCESFPKPKLNNNYFNQFSHQRNANTFNSNWTVPQKSYANAVNSNNANQINFNTPPAQQMAPPNTRQTESAENINPNAVSDNLNPLDMFQALRDLREIFQAYPEIFQILLNLKNGNTVQEKANILMAGLANP